MRRLPLALGLAAAATLACSGAPTPKPAPAPTPAKPTAPTPAKPAGRTVDLQVLSATSGTGVERIVDGDPSTGWHPTGDPDLEGVLLRFERPTELKTLTFLGCGPPAGAAVFVDGNELEIEELQDHPVVLPIGGKVRSIFLRLEDSPSACLAELAGEDADGPVRFEPPRAVEGTVRVSSTLDPEAAYAASYLFDGRTHFGWVEGDPGDGVGQWFEVTFAKPHEVKAIELWNGYQRSDDHFHKNARAKRVRVTVGEKAVELDVADRSGSQVLELGDTLRGKRVKVEVLQVYPGSAYKDLVISEVRFVGPKGPYGVDLPDRKQAEDALRTAIHGTPLQDVVGRAWVSKCQPELGTLKLRADASFVWYGESHDEGGGETTDATDLLDGAWALGKPDGDWATISLYARHQVVSKTYRPYGSEETDESTRISGGTLKIATAKGLGASALPAALDALAGPTGKDRVACAKGDPKALVDEGAILVKGTALTDLLVPVR